MKMIHNLWIHRTIAFINSLILILIINGFIGAPLWSFLIGLLALAIMLWEIQHPFIILNKFGFDKKDISIVRIVSLSIFFFIQCAILAWLIVS